MCEENWKGKGYAFFCNKECEAFPCHVTNNTEEFNCLFCYCPLYLLGEKCGGNFTYTKEGIKNCIDCSFPHEKNNYGKMIARMKLSS